MNRSFALVLSSESIEWRVDGHAGYHSPLSLPSHAHLGLIIESNWVEWRREYISECLGDWSMHLPGRIDGGANCQAIRRVKKRVRSVVYFDYFDPVMCFFTWMAA